MRCKTGAASAEQGEVAAGSQGSRRDKIWADLEARGVARELCETLSASLDERHYRRSPEAYQALLDGVALACGVQTELDGDLLRNLRDLRETERLMGAFAQELSKLDEVLEVLAAHLRRMRNVPGNASRFVQ
jgi:hypothetical protein